MKKASEREVHALLRLISVPGLGAYRLRKLLGHFGGAANILDAGFLDLTGVPGIERILARNILDKNRPEFADEQMKKCARAGARSLTILDDDYPENLRTISDPPIVLYTKGSFQSEDHLGIAVVGTRNPSAYGSSAADNLTRALVRNGMTIVSGLARGVDTVAHKSCLREGGRTIAVLGSGLDRVYPPENQGISDRISDSGAVVSEMHFGAKPDASNFPKRNRIVSGLSLGVLVIEAGEVSGALITVTSALDQNREVFAVPGNIQNPKSAGSNRLIKEGAKLVQNVDDVLEELHNKIRSFLKESPVYSRPVPNLSSAEQRVLSTLSDEPTHIDVIAQKAGLQTPQALSLLLTLELKELVSQISGARFVRC